MKLRMFTLFIIAVLSGCQSTETKTAKVTTNQSNQAFERLLSRFKQDASSVNYDQMWDAYLQSDQVQNTGDKQDKFVQISQQIAQNEMPCSAVNWDEITHMNFWSIKPHLAAQSCYEEIGDTKSAEYHSAAVEFLLSGILSSGDGEERYSAYEVATWGDASDIIELSGFEVIDSYYELAHSNQALYFVFVVNDPETGWQKEVYFENNRFLHVMLEVEFPFSGINDLLYTSIIDEFSKYETNAKIAKGKVLTQQGQYDEAVQVYLSAVNDGSVIGNYLVSGLCLRGDQTVLAQEECASYLLQSAEAGFITASVAVAFIYQEGLTVEKDEQLAQEIMASVEGYLAPGEAWFKFASLYGTALGKNDRKKQRVFFEKAKKAGSEDAAFMLVLMDLQDNQGDEAELAQMALSQLAELSKQGQEKAQAAYARLLMKVNEQDPATLAKAKAWLEASAEKGYPQSLFTLGSAYYSGFFGEKDLTKAFDAYYQSALKFNPDAQLKVGYFYDVGAAVKQDRQRAASWYFLCAKANNLICSRNLAVSFFLGEGVEQNMALASNLFEMGCKRKDGQSCQFLGNMYRDGKGLQQDYKKAIALFKQSCDYGDMGGCNNLGYLYANGDSGNTDFRLALEIFESACQKGYARSCDGLGDMYAQGAGVDQNNQKARELYKIACNKGYRESCHK